MILALDVLYSSSQKCLSEDDDEIIALSVLLNRLPIHPVENRRIDFRNPPGVARQINCFRVRWDTDKRDRRVGEMFYQVAAEFENRHDELHEIAEAIRRNEPYYTTRFGNPLEADDFPEGALLGHLHRMLEARDGGKVPLAERCEVCELQPTTCYQPCGELLQRHLLVPPERMNAKKRYAAEDFITVCPLCHEVLHRFRPWRTRENREAILR